MSDRDEVHRLFVAVDAGFGLTAEERSMVAAAVRRAETTVTTATFDERDALMVECCRRFYPGQSARYAAAKLAAEWRRYDADVWERDRSSSVCPARHVGTVREMLWAIQRVAPRPLSAERIRRILGHRYPN